MALAHSPDAPFQLEVWDEEWTVTFDADGGRPRPRIKGAYEIRNFLQDDDVENCSGGESTNC